MITDESHYVALAAAYVRGVLGERALDDDSAIARGVAANLKLHRFKRSAQLPRVRAVIGALRGFGASWSAGSLSGVSLTRPDGLARLGSSGRLVDLGSGRGAFVWPLLDALPDLALTATDLLDHRALLFAHVSRGGVARLTAARADMTALPFADASADCVTALEVLEHLPGDGPERAAAEALRVARVAVIATVPSKADDNPEHVHLFDGERLASMFRAAGARRVTIDHVLNHIVCVAVR